MQCHLEHLRTLRTETDIKEALGSLPPGLPATYKAMLDRIGRTPRDLKYALTAFMWLIHSPFPLNLRDLAVAAVIDPESGYEDSMRLTASDDILEICSSFIQVGPREIIEFAHFSVTEFFMSAVLPDGSRNHYHFEPERAHLLLLNSCFSYLCSRSRLPRYVPPLGLRAAVDDFHIHAALSWPQFAQKYPRNASISQRVYEFLQSNSFTFWSSLWYSKSINHYRNRRFYDDYVLPSSAPNPLYVAANFSLPSVVSMLLSNNVSPNQEGGFLNYPIFVAIAEENLEVLVMLLRAGADVNVKLLDGRTPLHYAARERNLPVVRLLVEWKADVTGEAQGITPLVTALTWCRWGLQFRLEAELVRLLSNDGKEIAIVQEAFVLAVEYDDFNSAKILVQVSDQSVLNFQDPDGNTRLHIAVNHGKEKRVSFLLEAGADDSITNTAGFRAIDLAAKAENVSMLQILGKTESEIECVDYSLDDIDLAFLLDLPRFHDVIAYVELLIHLSSLHPTEHRWYCHLARACFKLGEYTTAAKLWERSYQLNPQNDQVTSIERLAQSTECEKCHQPIYGRQWICTTCHKQFCEPCHKQVRMWYDCGPKGHLFIGIPAYSCQLRGDSWIEFSGDQHQEVYELLEEPLNPESYYVRDNPRPQYPTT